MFEIDDAFIDGLVAPAEVSFAAYSSPERPEMWSPALLDLALGLRSKGKTRDFSSIVFDPRIETEFVATIAPGGILTDVSFWVMEDRPDVWIRMGGVIAYKLFDEGLEYFAEGRWTKGKKGEAEPSLALVSAPLPPAGLLLGAGALALAGLRRRR